MPSTAAIEAEIERLSERRQAIWAGAEEAPPLEAQRLGARIADLYESKRQLLAQDGTGRKRSEIIRQARVESELERLMTR